ncbi:hypothetical protein Tco_0458299, partial [Tanacetum coccineum]
KKPNNPNAVADFQMLQASFDVLKDEYARKVAEIRKRKRADDEFEEMRRRDSEKREQDRMSSEYEKRYREDAANFDREQWDVYRDIQRILEEKMNADGPKLNENLCLAAVFSHKHATDLNSNGFQFSMMFFHIKMLKLRASQEGLEEEIADDEIMDKVWGSSRAFKPGRGRNLPKSTSSSFVRNYPSPEPLVSKSVLRRFVEAHNQQMEDWHAQLADKNIELRLPAPLDPNALLEDDTEPRDAADVLEDAANVLEDAAEPGEE